MCDQSFITFDRFLLAIQMKQHVDIIIFSIFGNCVVNICNSLPATVEGLQKFKSFIERVDLSRYVIFSADSTDHLCKFFWFFFVV